MLGADPRVLEGAPQDEDDAYLYLSVLGKSLESLELSRKQNKKNRLPVDRISKHGFLAQL